MNAPHDRIREAAVGMIALTEHYGRHPDAGVDKVREVLAPLLGDDFRELFAAGIRSSSDLPDVEYSTLYYDGLLRIVISHLPAGFEEKTHDHGNVNHVMVLAGAVDYRQFRLADEPTDAGIAHLETIDSRRLVAGDIGLVLPPPNDIHSLVIIENDTYLLTAMFSPSAPTRRFFDPEAGTYVEVPNQ